MNALTRSIAEYLNISLERAWCVQTEMMISGVNFGGLTLAALQDAIDDAYDDVLFVEIVGAACGHR
jgi:hypothetical protein